MRISDWSSDVCSSDLSMESSKGTLAGMGRPTGLEPATPGTTNQCSNRLSSGRHAHQAERTYVPPSQASRTAPANHVSEAVFDGTRVVLRRSSPWRRRQAGGTPNCHALPGSQKG